MYIHLFPCNNKYIANHMKPNNTFILCNKSKPFLEGSDVKSSLETDLDMALDINKPIYNKGLTSIVLPNGKNLTGIFFVIPVGALARLMSEPPTNQNESPTIIPSPNLVYTVLYGSFEDMQLFISILPPHIQNRLSIAHANSTPWTRNHKLHAF